VKNNMDDKIKQINRETIIDQMQRDRDICGKILDKLESLMTETSGIRNDRNREHKQ